MLIFKVWWHKKQEEPDIVRISNGDDPSHLDGLAHEFTQVLESEAYAVSRVEDSAP